MERLFKAVLIGLMFSASLAVAAEPIVYPAQNQSDDQRAQDIEECRQWALDQSGGSAVAPAAREQQPATENSEQTVLKGAAAGAAVGGLGGSMGGKFGKGAVAGAAAGAALGALKDHRSKQQAAATAPAENESGAQQSVFDRAYKACLEGRGYSVK